MILDPDNMSEDQIDQLLADTGRHVAKFRADYAGTLYVLRAGEFIKVGFTKGDVLDRIAALQTGCPTKLFLLGTGPGGRFIERELHKILKDYRSHGEWYRDAPIVRELTKRFCPISPLDS